MGQSIPESFKDHELDGRFVRSTVCRSEASHGASRCMGCTFRLLAKRRKRRLTMIRSGKFDHGFPGSVWEAAKAEAREAMIAVAKQQSVIFYSDLVAEISSCDLEPQSPQLAHMLGEVSTAEHSAGRGMLTVVVVHKSGDQCLVPDSSNWRVRWDTTRRTRNRSGLAKCKRCIRHGPGIRERLDETAAAEVRFSLFVRREEAHLRGANVLGSAASSLGSIVR